MSDPTEPDRSAHGEGAPQPWPGNGAPHPGYNPQGGYPPQGPPQQPYPQQGYPPGGYPPQGPPPPGPSGGGSGNRIGLILSGIALVILIGAGVVLVPELLDDGEDVAGETFLQPGEIFLQPAGTTGPDPFTDSTGAAPPEALAQTASDTETEIPTDGAAQLASDSGGSPGLFGGTRDNAACDREQMIRFLDDSSAKGQAWVDAMNADPNLQWADGPLTTANRAAYIRHLTPVFLTADTRVTNHGFRNGRANQIPAVLQAGTAVLVDAYGVPRVRCACGNPLIQPIAADRPPTYVGRSWPNFSPTQIRVISPPAQPVQSFTLTDPNTGQQYTVPAGSATPSGGSAATPPPTGGTPGSSPSAPATASPGHTILPAEGDVFRAEVPAGLPSGARASTRSGNPLIEYSPDPSALGSGQSVFGAPVVVVTLRLDGATGFSPDLSADPFYTQEGCSITTEPFTTPGGLTGEIQKVQACTGPNVPQGWQDWRGYVVRPDGLTVNFTLTKLPGQDLEQELLNTLDTLQYP